MPPLSQGWSGNRQMAATHGEANRIDQGRNREAKVVAFFSLAKLCMARPYYDIARVLERPEDRNVCYYDMQR